MQDSKMKIERVNLKTPREKLLSLCEHLNIANLTPEELHAADTFPYLEDTNVTDDFILGAQNVLLIMSETFIQCDIDFIDLPKLSKCYLYHWWKRNIEEFKDVKLPI